MLYSSIANMSFVGGSRTYLVQCWAFLAQASHLPWLVNNVLESSNFASPHLVSCDNYTLVVLMHVHVVQALRIT